MSPADFWRIKDDLVDEWNRKGYHLGDRNCNHFADAVLRRYGFEGLPGGYFSRFDHQDKQLWNTIAQLHGLSPQQADNIGKGLCGARDAVNKALKLKL